MSSEALLIQCIEADVPSRLAKIPNIEHLLFSYRDERGATLLHICAQHGALKTAKFLLEKGLDPNVKSKTNRTALHDSFESGADEVSQLLLDYGAEIDINYAAATNDLDTLSKLIKKDKHSVFDHSTGLTPIEWAAYGNSDKAIMFLAEHGLDVNYQDPDNHSTALMAAAQCNNCKAARALLELGGNPNLATTNGFTPLHYAATMKYAPDTTTITAMLLAYNAEVNIRADQALTPLGVLQQTREQQPSTARNYDGLQALLQIHGAVV